MTVTEAEIIEAARAAERAALLGEPADTGLLLDLVEQGQRLFADLLASRPGSRSVARIWSMTADELRAIVLARTVVTVLETAARQGNTLNSGPMN